MKNKFFTKTIALSILFCSAYLLTNAQAPDIKWQKTLGGSGFDGNSFGRIFSLHDGNFALVGQTNSIDGNFSSTINRGGMDAYVLKFRPNGNVIWAKTYGGSAEDNFNSLVENPDHTLTVAGGTYSNDAEVSGNHGDEDAWIVKLSANGTLLSQHCYGGTGEEWVTDLVRLNNGKYAFTGWSYSSDGDISINHGDNDVWVGMINQNRTLVWSKTFGGSNGEIGVGIFATQTNSLIVSGIAGSSTGDFQNYHGGDFDAFAMALNYSGNIIWSKCYGGSDADYSGFHSGRANDGNLLICGSTYSSDGDAIGNHGGSDSWTVKINNLNGNVIWSKCFGTSLFEYSYGIMTATNGDLIALGITGPDDELFGNINTDAQAIRMDKNGNQIWNKTFGGSNLEEVEAGVNLAGGDILLLGLTYYSDVDKDLWLVRLDGNDCHNHRDEMNLVSSANTISISNNPVSTSTTIFFSIPELENVLLQLFDLNGKLVLTISERVFDAGENQIEFNAEKLNAGIYFLKMQAGEFLKTEKLIVTK